MALRLAYSPSSTLPVEVEGLTPDRLRSMPLATIERTEVFLGNRRVPLAELFRVSGDPSDGRIEIEGDLERVHYIGAGMTEGEIVVHGSAGRHVGAGMRSGTIHVAGNAGDWAGAEMKGGVLRIDGSAADHAGGAYPGSRRGMTEGTILIAGDAGTDAGRSMRRGLLAIGGSCGDGPGSGMIAGTVLVFGECGRWIGAGMRRGTIGLFGPEPPGMLCSFRRAGRFHPLFFRLIVRELAAHRFAPILGLCLGRMTLYHGDLLSLGKGEVWTQHDGGAR